MIGESVNTLTFDVIRYVRTALRSIAFYFSIIVIALTTTVNPANASGGVPAGQSCGLTCYGYNVTQGDGYASPKLACNHASEWLGTTGCVPNGGSCTDCAWGSGICYYGNCSPTCPAHSKLSGTGTSCACNNPSVSDPANYVPDEPLRTSCVPEAVCPDHASGTPCVCDSGYEFDSTGTSCVSACPIDPLPTPPFTGDIDPACTASLEKGAGKDVDHKCPDLTADMQAGASCLADKIHALAIPYTEPSGTVRTEAYQKHFQDVWKKWVEIQNLKTDADKQACTAVIADVTREKDEIHGIDSPPSKKEGDAPHVLGDAVDVPRSVAKALIARVPAITVSMLPGCFSCTITITGDVENYVNSATVNPPACNLRWGGQFTPVDRVHFQLP